MHRSRKELFRKNKHKLIPESESREEEKQTICIVCNMKFDLVSAIFVPICNDCRKERNKSKKSDNIGEKG